MAQKPPLSTAPVIRQPDGSRLICDNGLHQAHMIAGLGGSIDFGELHAALKGMGPNNVFVDPKAKGPNGTECLKVTPNKKGDKFSNPGL